MSDELKACPFCGGAHELEKIRDMHFGICEEISCSGRVLMTAYNAEQAERMMELWESRPIEDALRAELAALKAAQEWISVDDRLPETGIVLAFGMLDGDTEPSVWTAICYADVNIWVDDYKRSKIIVTHWRPLPVPPQEADNA
jgi:hypothetical protein